VYKNEANMRNVEEYKQIYKDLQFWETVVKTREEHNKRGKGHGGEDKINDGFLEDAKRKCMQLKKKERNHILSGTMDERDIWYDSDDDDDEEEDDDSEEEMEILSGSAAGDEPSDTSGDDQREDKRMNKRKKMTDEKLQEDNEAEDMSDQDTVIMGEKYEEEGSVKSTMEDKGTQQWNEKNNKYGWTEVKSKKDNKKKEKQGKEKITKTLSTKAGFTQAKLSFGRGSGTTNPYYRNMKDVAGKKPEIGEKKETQKDKNSASIPGKIPAYLDAIEAKKRKESEFNVRSNCAIKLLDQL
jgi:hypothetical protein